MKSSDSNLEGKPFADRAAATYSALKNEIGGLDTILAADIEFIKKLKTDIQNLENKMTYVPESDRDEFQKKIDECKKSIEKCEEYAGDYRKGLSELRYKLLSDVENDIPSLFPRKSSIYVATAKDGKDAISLKGRLKTLKENPTKTVGLVNSVKISKNYDRVVRKIKEGFNLIEEHLKYYHKSFDTFMTNYLVPCRSTLEELESKMKNYEFLAEPNSEFLAKPNSSLDSSSNSITSSTSSSSIPTVTTTTTPKSSSLAHSEIQNPRFISSDPGYRKPKSKDKGKGRDEERNKEKKGKVKERNKGKERDKETRGEALVGAPVLGHGGTTSTSPTLTTTTTTTMVTTLQATKTISATPKTREESEQNELARREQADMEYNLRLRRKPALTKYIEPERREKPKADTSKKDKKTKPSHHEALGGQRETPSKSPKTTAVTSPLQLPRKMDRSIFGQNEEKELSKRARPTLAHTDVPKSEKDKEKSKRAHEEEKQHLNRRSKK